MDFSKIKEQVEEVNPDVDDDTVNQVLEVVKSVGERKDHRVKTDKNEMIAQLQSEMLNETDWRKKSAKAAQIMNLKHFDYLDT